MVGAEVSITPPVRGAAPGASGGFASSNLREGRGQSPVVPGVKVPAAEDRPPGVQMGAMRPVALSADALWCQQVIPNKIIIQFNIFVFSVAVLFVIIRQRDTGLGRVPSLKAGFPWWDGDGDGLAGLAAEPARLPTEDVGDPGSVTWKVKPDAHRVGHLGPLVIPPLRFPKMSSMRNTECVGIKVYAYASKTLQVVSLLLSHGCLQVVHLEFLLRQSLLEPLQVGFTRLQLRLYVLDGVQVHSWDFAIGKFIPPVFGKFFLFPHNAVHSGLSADRSLVTQMLPLTVLRLHRQLAAYLSQISTFLPPLRFTRKCSLSVFPRPLSDHL